MDVVFSKGCFQKKKNFGNYQGLFEELSSMSVSKDNLFNGFSSLGDFVGVGVFGEGEEPISRKLGGKTSFVSSYFCFFLNPVISGSSSENQVITYDGSLRAFRTYNKKPNSFLLKKAGSLFSRDISDHVLFDDCVRFEEYSFNNSKSYDFKKHDGSSIYLLTPNLLDSVRNLK